MAKCLIIAPHCDDALLAMGGHILLNRNGYKVVTLFATCAWTIRPDLFRLDSLSVINKQEEIDALTKAECDFALYDLPEAFLRGYTEWNATVKLTSDKATIQQCLKYIKTHIQGVDAIYIPMAIGNHVDHRLVYDVAIEFINSLLKNDKKVYLYEDLPYAWHGGLEERLEEIRESYALTPNSLNIELELGRKLELLKTYTSQLNDVDLDRVRQYATCVIPKGAGERVWQIQKR